jgi:hypothetical protein
MIAISAHTGPSRAKAAATLMMLAAVLGCADATAVNDPDHLTAVSVFPKALRIAVGAETPLLATGVDANGGSISNPPVTWSSSNPEVATISAGVVHGVAAGTAYIRATSGTMGDSAVITVNGAQLSPSAPPVVTTITLTPANPTLLVGATQTLTATAKDQYGNVMAGQSLMWSSSDSSIMSISQGIVTALGVGLAILNVSSDGVNASTQVTVIAPSQAAGPNEPIGMTPLFHLDGTTLDLGSRYSYGAKWTDGRHVVVVDDTDAPKGKAVEMRWFLGEDEGGAGGVFWNRFSQNGSGITPQREIYIRAVFKFSPTWETHPGGNKLWYHGTVDRVGSQGAVQLYASVQPSLQARVVDQSGDGTRGVWGGGSAAWGVYHTLEVYQRAQTAAGVADGVIRVWLDGVLIKYDPAVMIHDASTGYNDMRFDGLQFFSYWGGSGGYTKSVSPYDWLRWGEFYMSGKP